MDRGQSAGQGVGQDWPGFLAPPSTPNSTVPRGQVVGNQKSTHFELLNASTVCHATVCK